MVAYGFKAMFVEPIRAGTKIGTIRAPRKRHVRPGEAMQLYCGMRRKGCFKIIPDVVCLRVNEIELDLSQPSSVLLVSNGVPIADVAELNRFAAADGFGGKHPFLNMTDFWEATHGRIRFRGVHIIWGVARSEDK